MDRTWPRELWPGGRHTRPHTGEAAGHHSCRDRGQGHHHGGWRHLCSWHGLYCVGADTPWQWLADVGARLRAGDGGWWSQGHTRCHAVTITVIRHPSGPCYCHSSATWAICAQLSANSLPCSQWGKSGSLCSPWWFHKCSWSRWIILLFKWTFWLHCALLVVVVQFTWPHRPIRTNHMTPSTNQSWMALALGPMVLVLGYGSRSRQIIIYRMFFLTDGLS